MGRAIESHAQVPDASPVEYREPSRMRMVPTFWWVLRDVCSEIKAEFRLIIG